LWGFRVYIGAVIRQIFRIQCLFNFPHPIMNITQLRTKKIINGSTQQPYVELECSPGLLNGSLGFHAIFNGLFKGLFGFFKKMD